MSTKITAFEIENLKRIKAVKMEPSSNGLTVIGGGNGQGKTSILDGIAYALGGEKFRPSEVKRSNSVTEPYMRIELSNGLIVERKGKKSALVVTDVTGKKAGQQLLDCFVEKLALNLPKFMESSGKEKADVLLKIIGVGDDLDRLDRQEKDLYQERLYIGRVADQKRKYADELPFFEDVPDEPVSASELIRQQQEILARNGENERKRQNAAEIERRCDLLEKELSDAYGRAAEAERKLEEAKAAYDQACIDKETAFHIASQLRDESTAELEKNLAEIEELNRKIRANLDKEKASSDAGLVQKQYDQLTMDIEEVRKARTALLDGANLPLPELSVSAGELIYKGQKWDNMSGSERLMVATAIVRKLNPECGFVLMDKLEQMDLNTLREFSSWLEKEGLQVIATRVSSGDECSIIIEDGYVAEEKPDRPPEPETIDWSKIEL